MDYVNCFAQRKGNQKSHTIVVNKAIIQRRDPMESVINLDKTELKRFSNPACKLSLRWRNYRWDCISNNEFPVLTNSNMV